MATAPTLNPASTSTSAWPAASSGKTETAKCVDFLNLIGDLLANIESRFVPGTARTDPATGSTKPTPSATKKIGGELTKESKDKNQQEGQNGTADASGAATLTTSVPVQKPVVLSLTIDLQPSAGSTETPFTAKHGTTAEPVIAGGTTPLPAVDLTGTQTDAPDTRLLEGGLAFRAVIQPNAAHASVPAPTPVKPEGVHVDSPVARQWVPTEKADAPVPVPQAPPTQEKGETVRLSPSSEVPPPPDRSPQAPALPSVQAKQLMPSATAPPETGNAKPNTSAPAALSSESKPLTSDKQIAPASSHVTANQQPSGEPETTPPLDHNASMPLAHAEAPGRPSMQVFDTATTAPPPPRPAEVTEQASAGRIEPEPAKAPPTPPVQEMAIRVQPEAGGPKVDLHVVERSGRLSVDVRTADPDLTQSLRSNVGQLVTKLEENGFKSQTSIPVAAISGVAATGQSSLQGDSQGSDANPGQSRNQTPGQDQHQQPDRRVPDAWEQYFEDTLNDDLKARNY